jgi:hypothetical protein
MDVRLASDRALVREVIKDGMHSEIAAQELSLRSAISDEAWRQNVADMRHQFCQGRPRYSLS